jgi:hypothetical protein
MKPLHVGLLAFCATLAVGIAVIMTKLPMAEVAKPPVPPVAVDTSPATVSLAPPPLRMRRRRAKAKSLAKENNSTDARRTQPTSAVPFHPWNGSFESGGIFSGADPNDPRIYH